MQFVYVLAFLDLYFLPAGLFVVVCCVVGCGSVVEPPEYDKRKLAKRSKLYGILLVLISLKNYS